MNEAINTFQALVAELKRMNDREDALLAMAPVTLSSAAQMLGVSTVEARAIIQAAGGEVFLQTYPNGKQRRAVSFADLQRARAHRIPRPDSAKIKTRLELAENGWQS